ncbi:hypothetical protein [Klebsiella quasivariicola]|uniref:hypothetical protein n=1 Tax=Klebsiella quasivariicola TaxID=2026240 RepID=UPI00247AE3AD|nr:hypothetical protein [Klebsiella quasivariicola]
MKKYIFALCLLAPLAAQANSMSKNYIYDCVSGDKVTTAGLMIEPLNGVQMVVPAFLPDGIHMGMYPFHSYAELENGVMSTVRDSEIGVKVNKNSAQVIYKNNATTITAQCTLNEEYTANANLK